MKSKVAGQCEGSIYLDPKLTGGATYSADAYKLLPDSPAINKGIAVEGIVDDYDGNARIDISDIGAFEFIKNSK